jgi:hypothetical protein
MKILLISLIFAVNSFGFVEYLTDGKNMMSTEEMVECQQDYNLYLTNRSYLAEKSYKSNELAKLDTAVAKATVGTSEYCYYLKSFNIKAKELIEAKRIK